MDFFVATRWFANSDAASEIPREGNRSIPGLFRSCFPGFLAEIMLLRIGADEKCYLHIRNKLWG